MTLRDANDLLSNLTKACEYLEGLEATATQAPDIFEYLVKEANVPHSWLVRFRQNRCSGWGKAHRGGDNEPLAYHKKDRDDIWLPSFQLSPSLQM